MRFSVTAALCAFVAGMPQPASGAAWTLSLSTYFGGNDITSATAIAVDRSGGIYVAGWTDSASLPGCSPIRPNAGGVDAFVVKWDGVTHHIAYCTFLGGRGDDRAFAIAVDGSGDAYITGWTMSANFPVSEALQAALAGAKNAFVAKLNPAGVLVYSSYLGGNGYDSGNAIAVDSADNATVVGNTTSTNFPLANPIQSSLKGQTSVFVSRLSPAGDSLVYSTYLGGNGNDCGTAVVLDGTGAAYLTGSTTSTNFPTANAFQPTSGGNQDAFVTKIDNAGDSLLYSTYLGGSGGTVGFPETGSGIAVDSAGDAYVTGTTSSPNFPLANALFSNSAGVGIHTFVTELNPAGNGLVYSTYLGGSSVDQAAAIALDSGGNAIIAGFTASPDFPLANPAQESLAGGYDAFVTRLNFTGTALLESTFFGGRGSDAANAVAYDAADTVYVAGQTQSSNFPIENATQPALAGVQNAFLAVFTLTPQVSPPPAPTGLTATAGNTSVALSWSASSGATSYKVYRGATAGGESATAIATGITTTSYPDTGLTVGTTYFYKVAAANAGGTSALSAEVSATTSGSAPTLQSVSPQTGQSATVTFSATYSDVYGANAITVAGLLIQAPSAGASACYVVYLGGTNQIGLVNDAGTVGYVTMGGSGTVSNSRCTLSGSGSSVTVSGSQLILSPALTFLPAFGGAKAVYMYAAAGAITAGWQAMGSWTVPGTAPQAVSVSPNSGQGATPNFAATFWDASGGAAITVAELLINSAPAGVNACYVVYVGGNQIGLVNDASTVVSYVTMGGGGTVSNSQCTLSGSGSSVSTSGTQLVLSPALTFLPAFGGAKSIYLYATTGALNSGWQTLGTWTVPGDAPQAVSVSPNSGQGATPNFAATFSDASGATAITVADLLIQAPSAAASVCYVVYLGGSNQIGLVNDAGTVSYVTMGGGGTVSNSQCTLSGSGSSAAVSGSQLILSPALTFLPGFGGAKAVYMYAAAGALTNGWQAMGAWTAP